MTTIKQGDGSVATFEGESPKPALRWTAGPWRYAIKQESIYSETAVRADTDFAGNPLPVCVASFEYGGVEDADARLMTAAPDMASALLAVTAWDDAQTGRPYDWDTFHAIMQEARAALRKAGALP